MTATTRTTRLALAAAVATGLVVLAGTPADAAPPREPRSAAYAVSPYVEPLAAVGGRSLAQYVADHQAHGPAGGALV